MERAQRPVGKAQQQGTVAAQALEAAAHRAPVEHHREGMAIPVTESEVELTVAMRDEHHCSVLLESLRSLGYQVERLR